MEGSENKSNQMTNFYTRIYFTQYCFINLMTIQNVCMCYDDWKSSRASHTKTRYLWWILLITLQIIERPTFYTFIIIFFLKVQSIPRSAKNKQTKNHFISVATFFLQETFEFTKYIQSISYFYIRHPVTKLGERTSLTDYMKAKRKQNHPVFETRTVRNKRHTSPVCKKKANSGQTK